MFNISIFFAVAEEVIELEKIKELKVYPQINSVWVSPVSRYKGLSQIDVEGTVDGESFVGKQARVLYVELNTLFRFVYIETMGVGLEGCCKKVLETKYFRITNKYNEIFGTDFTINEWLSSNEFIFSSNSICYSASFNEENKLKYEKIQCT